MASVLDLFGRLFLDTSAYEESLDKAKNQAGDSGNHIGASFKKGLKVVGAAITAASTAVTAFSKTALDSSISFETAFTGVTKTVDETATTSYQMISDAIKKMATETSSSKEVIAGVMEAAGQLGVSADDIVGFTKTMIELGDTTNLSADEAAVALARFTNITGLSANDVDKLGSAIVDLGNNFATDEASIVSMSTRLAAAGTIAGLSSTDILALSTAMSSVGIEAEAGGTAMSTVLTKIGNAVANGSDKVELFASTAGMTAQEFANEWKTSPVEALSAFIVGLDKMNESGDNVNAVLEELAIKGIRETNMVKSLALASGVLTDAVNTSNTAFQENVALTDEAEKRYNTTESKINQLKEAYSNLRIEIGDRLKPTLGEFIEYGKTSMEDLSVAFRERGLQGALQALGPVIDQGIQLLFNALPKVLEAGIALLDALVTGIITNLPKLVPAAVQLIQTLTQNIVTNLPKLLDAAIEIISALADGIIEMLPQLIPAIVQIILTIVEKLTEPGTLVQLIDAALRIAIAIGEGLIRAIPEIVKAIPQIIENIITSFLDGRGRISEAGKELLEKAKDGFAEAIPNLINKAKEAADKAYESIKSKWETAKSLGNILITLLRDGISAKASSLQDSVSKIAKNTHDAISKTWNNAKALGASLINNIRAGIAERVSGITAQIQSLKDSISNIFRNLADAAASWGRDLIGNFVSGLQDKLQALKDKAVAIAQEIKNVIGFSEPKEGPLSNFHTYAPDMMQLFAKGIRDNENLITDAISSSFNFGDQIGAGFNQGHVVSMGESQPVSGGVRNMTTILQVDRTELGRIVYQLYNEESQRMGVKLAAGGIA